MEGYGFGHVAGVGDHEAEVAGLGAVGASVAGLFEAAHASVEREAPGLRDRLQAPLNVLLGQVALLGKFARRHRPVPLPLERRPRRPDLVVDVLLAVGDDDYLPVLGVTEDAFYPDVGVGGEAEALERKKKERKEKINIDKEKREKGQ